MANDNKGGRRLAGSRQAPQYSRMDDLESTIAFSGDAAARPSVDDAVVDEILRSISEQSGTPVPSASRGSRPAVQPEPVRPASPAGQQTTAYRHPQENEYEAAAARARQSQQIPQAQSNSGTLPDPSYYAMRDPSQTQSFQPARPAHRDTDRLPTLVDEKPGRRRTALGKFLTFVVVILVVVALVLGVKMAYILGPSLGWNLPDLTQIPVISSIVELLPSEDTTPQLPVEEDNEEQDAAPVVEPTSVTLDVESVTLAEGESIVLTATLDVEDWDGSIAWGISGKDQIATVTPIGPTTAQVNYVGEGTCYVTAVLAISTEDDEERPYASCQVVCEAPSQVDDGETDGEEGTAEPTGEHVDVVLNREDFTLNVGERHSLMDENADQVTWTSSNESVATVSEAGIVTAVSAGTATITATGPDGATASAIARVR